MGRKSKFTEAEIRAMLGEVEAGATVRAVCKREGVTEKTFYRWRNRFGDEATLTADGVLAQIQALEDENRRLRALVAELSLENYGLRSAAREKSSSTTPSRPDRR
jgi:putative transposase